MIDIDQNSSTCQRDVARVYALGYDSIAEYNKYHYYTKTKVWVVGLGMLIGNYDVRNYDPDEYSDIALFTLVFRDKFIDIGGPGVQVMKYLDILNKYYPETSDEVLRITVVSRMENNPIIPVVITDTNHPSVLQLYTQIGRDISGEKTIYTTAQIEDIRTMINQESYGVVWSI